MNTMPNAISKLYSDDLQSKLSNLNIFKDNKTVNTIKNTKRFFFQKIRINFFKATWFKEYDNKKILNEHM